MPRPVSADTSHRFITRAAYAAWRVWVQFGDIDLGQLYVSDQEFGGKTESLRKAIKLRDTLVKKHGIPLRTYDGNGFHAKHKNNKSGVCGINLSVTHADTDYMRVSWRTASTINGERIILSKSIKRYGYIGAWRLIAQERERHTGLKAPRMPPKPPEWLIAWAAERNIVLGS